MQRACELFRRNGAAVDGGTTKSPTRWNEVEAGNAQKNKKNMEKKRNYQKELDSLLAGLDGERPKLLLHACCGPCSSYVIEFLAEFFEITILYYNPNIYPNEEYERRLNEIIDFLPKFEPAVKNKVCFVEDVYNPQEFYDAVNTKNEPDLAVEAEKGERCRRCYEFRLRRGFDYALNNDFDYFCTTLSISPFKDAEKINVLGAEIVDEFLKNHSAGEEKKVPKWLVSDFKKKGGFKRSLEISQEFNLYRQQYCGCVYSKVNKENYEK